jgi:hypothetical protein
MVRRACSPGRIRSPKAVEDSRARAPKVEAYDTAIIGPDLPLFHLSVDIAILFLTIPGMLNFSPSTQRSAAQGRRDAAPSNAVRDVRPTEAEPMKEEGRRVIMPVPMDGPSPVAVCVDMPYDDSRFIA